MPVDERQLSRSFKQQLPSVAQLARPLRPPILSNQKVADHFGYSSRIEQLMPFARRQAMIRLLSRSH